MNEEQNKIKGGVIIVGSLIWEDESNAINEPESKALAERRKEWRKTFLDLDKEERHPLPIRYGRSSSSRKCTYTIVFSREVIGKNSSALVIPYKEEIDFSNYLHFERQARILAEVEGISKNNDGRLRKEWGCIAIYINPESNYSHIIKNHWNNLMMTDLGYETKPQYYNPDADAPLIDDNYRLIPDVEIKTKIDFLFFIYVRVGHRKLNNSGKASREYPSAEEVAEEINRSGYTTYLKENIERKITTYQDVEINDFLDTDKKVL